MPTYQKLIEFHKAGKLSFKYVKTFNMDEYCGKYVNIYFYLTLSLIQHFCSRWLNIFCQKIENLYNWMDNLIWLKVENIVAKGEICCHYVFKKPSAPGNQKASIWGKGLKIKRRFRICGYFVTSLKRFIF